MLAGFTLPVGMARSGRLLITTWMDELTQHLVREYPPSRSGQVGAGWTDHVRSVLMQVGDLDVGLGR